MRVLVLIRMEKVHWGSPLDMIPILIEFSIFLLLVLFARAHIQIILQKIPVAILTRSHLLAVHVRHQDDLNGAL